MICSIVKKRCTSTWSSSATSTLESPRPQVQPQDDSFLITRHLHISGHLIYKCGGIDKRTIEKFEKVCLRLHVARLLAIFESFFWWGRLPRRSPNFGLSHSYKRIKTHTDSEHRKPPSWARAPSSTHGSWTNSRPSVSVVSPSTLHYGNSRHPNTMSLLLVRWPLVQ